MNKDVVLLSLDFILLCSLSIDNLVDLDAYVIYILSFF